MMTLTISTTIEKIRTAIDDVKSTTLDDDFSVDVDNELKQALEHSVESLLMELPAHLVEPTVIVESIPTTPTTPITPITTESSWSRETGGMGDGIIKLPSDFLRFLDMKISTWSGTLYELIEKGSDDEKKQRSEWSRGTNTKPKAMLDHHSDGKRIIRYWPGGSDKTLEHLSYVPKCDELVDALTCALRDETEKTVIYRAASIFLEGKKEHELAEHFRVLSMM